MHLISDKESKKEIIHTHSLIRKKKEKLSNNSNRIIKKIPILEEKNGEINVIIIEKFLLIILLSNLIIKY